MHVMNASELTTCTHPREPLSALFVTASACLFNNPLRGCVVQFSDRASLMLTSMDSVSYIHCPS